MNHFRLVQLALCVVFALVGCTGGEKLDSADGQPAAASAAIAAAIADPRRPAADVDRDAGRKPQTVLELAELGPGMSVLDLFAGGGYYTELAAYVVGAEGRVVAYNNVGYSMAAAREIATRYADGRLATIEQLSSENNEMELPASTFDVVLFMLAYHDVYYLDGERGWVLIDRPRLLQEVFEAVKPGGRVIVADHVATGDMTHEQARAMHRIDPELIKADFRAAGFRLDAESDALRNPDDDFAINAMAPTVRGRTDRALLRFIKP